MDAIRLQSWYATSQGETAVGLLADTLTRWLENLPAQRSLGIGFVQPYLERFAPWSGALLAAAPAEMGVAPWSTGHGNRVALVRPDALPFPDEWFDRVILIHLLEGALHPASALREVWRVLRPGGRLLVVVPNRGGLWARHDSTPFGWGRPFSPAQLQTQLQDSLFIPRQSSFALFMPPFSGPRLLRSAPTWEKIGQRWFAPLGGVILCDAEKVVYATVPFGRSYGEERRKLAIPVVNSRRKVNSLRRDGLS